MLYRFLHFIFNYAVRKYFRHIRVQNRDIIPKDKPVILFPNHRSAFMDPIVVAALINRPVYFLARGESFRLKVLAAIFKTLHMIPIYRKEFSPDEAHKNDEVFVHCHNLLADKGMLMIFPEGLSQTKPRLLPFKTGSARIALGAEEKYDFNLDIHLVPVGINYTNPHRFQSDLFLNFGEPLRTADYREQFKKEPFEAVKQLTANMENALRERIITLDGKRWFDLSEKVEEIVQSEPETFLGNSRGAAFDWFLAKKEINGAIDYYKKEKPELLQHFEQRTNAYLGMLQRLKITDRSVSTRNERLSLYHNMPMLLAYLIVLLPLFLVGLLLMGLPFLLTRFLALKIVKRTDFMGSVVLALGLLVFTIFAAFEAWWLARFTGYWWAGVLLVFLLPPLGMITRRYYMHLLHFTRNRRWLIMGSRNNRLAQLVVNEKESLLKEFAAAYKKYAAKKEG